MHRHYFFSDDLDDLKRTQTDLLASGSSEPQLHVLSDADSELYLRHLNQVDSFSKRDIIHSGLIGAAVGCIMSAGVLMSGIYFDAIQTVGWTPFVFVAGVVFAFCVWEGGLFGIQSKNIEFRRFSDLLKQGKHILMLDITDDQSEAMKSIVAEHPNLHYSGEGTSRPEWIIRSQNGWKSFVNFMP